MIRVNSKQRKNEVNRNRKRSNDEGWDVQTSSRAAISSQIEAAIEKLGSDKTRHTENKITIN